MQQKKNIYNCNIGSCVHRRVCVVSFCSKHFYMFNVRLFCELFRFNLYSNGCVFEFVVGCFFVHLM